MLAGLLTIWTPAGRQTAMRLKSFGAVRAVPHRQTTWGTSLSAFELMLQLAGRLNSLPAAFTTFRLVSFMLDNQTVLVFVISVDSAACDVCTAAVPIMLCFSVPLLGASLLCRRRRRQQNLHLKLKNNFDCSS